MRSLEEWADAVWALAHGLEEKRMKKIVEIIRDKGYKVELKDVNKNGVIKKAIAISPKDSAMAPVLYLDNYDFDGNTDEETADFLIDIAKRHFADLSIDAEGLITWTNALKNLRVGLRTIALDTYGDGLVTRRRFDMEEYLYIKVKVSGDKAGSIKITEQLFDNWHKGIEEVFDIAEQNTFADCHYEDMRMALFDADIPEDVIGTLPPVTMYVISNDTKTNGAVGMLSVDILAEIADQFENDVYILPSSIHEVLAISAAEVKNVEDLEKMVYEVNTHEVSPEERLSYSVFFFNRETRELSKA